MINWWTHKWPLNDSGSSVGIDHFFSFPIFRCKTANKSSYDPSYKKAHSSFCRYVQMNYFVLFLKLTSHTSSYYFSLSVDFRSWCPKGTIFFPLNDTLDLNSKSRANNFQTRNRTILRNVSYRVFWIMTVSCTRM